MFDPCGTRHADGEELIRRLAVHLKVTPKELEFALISLVSKAQDDEAKDKMNDEGGCGCGD